MDRKRAVHQRLQKAEIELRSSAVVWAQMAKREPRDVHDSAFRLIDLKLQRAAIRFAAAHRAAKLEGF